MEETGLRMGERRRSFTAVTEIIFNVERCEESGWLSASWDAPDAGGGIVTQGKDLDELQAMIKEAVHCHFGGDKAPQSVRLHFLTDPVLATA
jgi:predicted RNase H-like HicB family nuclease